MGIFDFIFRRKKEKPVEQPPLNTEKQFGKHRPAEQKREGRPQQQQPASASAQQRSSTEKSQRPHANRPTRQQFSQGGKQAVAAKGKQTNQRKYTVKTGDSLSRIAKQFYGDANDWQKIYQANKNRIKDPNVIHAGQSLVIPE